MSQDYGKKAVKLDSHVPGDDNTPSQGKLKTFGVDGRVLGPTVGAWCETSTDFDLLVELIAHALADEETSTIQVAHNQCFGNISPGRSTSWTTGSSSR